MTTEEQILAMFRSVSAFTDKRLIGEDAWTIATREIEVLACQRQHGPGWGACSRRHNCNSCLFPDQINA